MTLHPITDVNLSRYDPEDLRVRVVSGGADAFASGLLEALKPRTRCKECKQVGGYHRWAFLLFSKVAKLVQADTLILMAVLQKIGVGTEDELRTLVESGRRMEQLRDGDVDAATMADDFVEGLKLIFARAPELRASVMARLSSGVVEVPANGNGNGAHE